MRPPFGIRCNKRTAQPSQSHSPRIHPAGRAEDGQAESASVFGRRGGICQESKQLQGDLAHSAIGIAGWIVRSQRAELIVGRLATSPMQLLTCSAVGPSGAAQVLAKQLTGHERPDPRGCAPRQTLRRADRLRSINRCRKGFPKSLRHDHLCPPNEAALSSSGSGPDA
jgi:hypothetical protein